MQDSPFIPDRVLARSGLTQTCLQGDGSLTFAVKDCIDLAGLPTCQGSAVFAQSPPAAHNARVVSAMLSTGDWRVTGKAAMHELAFGVTGVNDWAGTPVNPQWPDRIVGGSSSGSAAAVAGGVVDMALGTDTGGSVRLPAACCGVVGLKPGYGVVSREGVHPAASSLDCVGPIARSVALVERAMAAMVPHYDAVATPEHVRLVRLHPVVDSSVAETFDAAMTRLAAASGVSLVEGDLPMLDPAFHASLVIMGAENWAAIGALSDHPAMGEDVRARLKAGAAHGPDAIAAAETVRADLIAQIDALLTEADALILPTLPMIPPTLVEAQDARAVVPLTRLVRPFNLSGHPAITLPVRSAEGLPVGVQLVGRRGEDAVLLAVARKLAVALGLEETIA
jgi:amidase